ncbi:Hypothetical predicted protein [Xyrichtys novacula]|uniref:Uncharacterized protein n=1 Tax=Xyrichtys novacula TaxID=13765 RepID=A0AAV1HLK4_XYRNO|nr:Hypothetical predicted protein [Xyrichtys novacula]
MALCMSAMFACVYSGAGLCLTFVPDGSVRAERYFRDEESAEAKMCGEDVSGVVMWKPMIDIPISHLTRTLLEIHMRVMGVSRVAAACLTLLTWFSYYHAEHYAPDSHVCGQHGCQELEQANPSSAMRPDQLTRGQSKQT